MIIKLLGKTSKLIFGLAMLTFGAVLILAVAYFLGFSYLQAITGTDSLNALNNIHWFARFWPRIPFWYPGQGGGVSHVWGYPVLSSLMVIVISAWQKINLAAAFRALGFFSLPITAVGMYFFVWRRLKSQAMALIAAVFYLLMPISWIWLFDWGFYAEQIAYIFVFPAWLAFDRFLEGFIEKKINGQARVCLFLTVFFLGLIFAIHPLVFFALIRVFAIYSPIYFLVKRRKLKVKNLVAAFLPTLMILVLTALAMIFLTGNYQYYLKDSEFSGTEALLQSKEDFIFYYSVPIKPLLGLAEIPLDHIKFTIRNLVVPMLVWLPAIGGTVLALFLSSKVFGLALSGWLAFLFLAKPEIVYVLFSSKIPFLAYFVGMRTEVFILKMIVPITAAFGIWAAPTLILRLTTFWLKFKNRFLNWGLEVLKGSIVTVVSLAAAGFLIFYFANQPAHIWKREEVRYGPYPFSIRDPFGKFSLDQTLVIDSEEKKEPGDLLVGYLFAACEGLEEKREAPNFCLDFLKEEAPIRKEIFNDLVLRCHQDKERKEEKAFCPLVAKEEKQILRKMAMALLDKDYWPRPDWQSDFEFPFPGLNEFNRQFGYDQFLRLDVSPKLGGVTQTLNIFNQASMINLYTVQLNLLGPYWGYQQQVMFSEFDGQVKTVNELAKWFGTRFVLMDDKLDPIDKYQKDSNWQNWPGHQWVWEYQQAPKLWTLTTGKPTVLVIGNKEKRAFEPVFRAANQGALPYDDFWLVRGGEYVDNYSLAELEKFDILMLFGYKWKSRRKAIGLLDKYLKKGGSLFISAGWQYVDQVWETDEAPVFFPARSLTWTDQFGSASQYRFESDLIGLVETASFGPLVWSEKGWGVSVASNLQPWARPILTVDNQPLVVGGEFGQGRVVLTGLNLIGHMHSFDYNQSEVEFFRKTLNWLGQPQSKDLSESLSVSRDNPDKIQFVFNQEVNQDSVFYFRESFFPSWKAKLVQSSRQQGGQAKLKAKSLKIYKAGPNFKLINLPSLSAGDSLILEFKPGIRHWFLVLVSAVVFLGLIAWVIFGRKLYEPFWMLVRGRFTKAKSKIKKSWEEEE